jgi:hypothetical protein
MVSALRDSTRFPVLLISAVLLPLLASSLFVFLVRGQSFGSRVLDVGCWIVVLCSGVPFIVLLPISRLRRLLIGALLVPLSFALDVMWALYVSCMAFGSCL